MARRCFFVEGIGPGEEQVVLSEDVAHHLESVLRLKAGETVDLRDGKGRGWQGVIEEIKGKSVRVRIVGERMVPTESGLDLTLVMAIAKADRMDLVVRQATELGVRRFIAFRSARSQYGLEGAQARKRVERWQKISREALCQCDRMKIPEISVLSSLEDLLGYCSSSPEENGAELRILGYEDERHQGLLSLWRDYPACARVLAVVGPEGGWAREEVDRFLGSGFHAVHLGPRILRLETAAVAFISSAQLLWGDFGA